MSMGDVHFTVPRFCGCQTGFFYVRRCGRPSVLQCGRCGLDVCDEHAHRPEGDPVRVFCPDCQAAQSGSGASSFARRQGGGFSRGSGGYYDDSFSGQGGPVWGEGDRDGPAFADEDYAAFDALSDFDVNADDGHAYDS